MAAWTVDRVWKQKPQGDVWIVHNEVGQRGYFKVPGLNKYYGGTMIANELISALLAKKLGFPVADISVARLRGPDGLERTGIVSLQRNAKEMTTWRDASKRVKANLRQYVWDVQKLREMVVFDAWILNTDRASGKNLILHRDNELDKYYWYLIDHGNTLYGSPYRWRRASWQSAHWYYLWKYYLVPQGLLKEQSNYALLKPMIEQIQSLSGATINDMVQKVPLQYLSDYERRVITEILLRRQARLHYIIDRWLKYTGKKSSQ